jgi:hypothetical protein
VAFVAIEHIDNNLIVKSSLVMMEIQPYHVATYFDNKTAALNYANSEINYWQEVKQEIEKL